ncbi:pyridoxal phosphate-dependent transferase [Lipomyces chichibuensis]|uniref:pyridoxal phosphate-dependent transferase n=1 Tax=Lipomyces chichibuensis TaxID=1546026 RepID=UPI0033442A9D
MASVVKNSIAKGVDLKAMVVINPCNPTGSCLSREEIKDIITLAAENTFMVIADEQDVPLNYDSVELASFHSTSKDEQVIEQLYKLGSIQLCHAVSGQVLTEFMVNPPKPGDESYSLYKEEVDAIYKALKERALLLFKGFKEMEAVSCQEPMVSLKSIHLCPNYSLTCYIPQKAIKEAQRRNEEPDQFYCLELLEQDWCMCSPGLRLRQKDGMYHFCTTFLAPGEEYVRRIIGFHTEFLKIIHRGFGGDVIFVSWETCLSYLVVACPC